MNKKQLIVQQIDAGITDPADIFSAIASTGVPVSVRYIRDILSERSLNKRVDEGKQIPYLVQPYAVSGVTGNRIANKYLEGVKSEGGGFLKTAVYDIETTGLFADFGYVLTCTFKDVDSGEIKVFRLDETNIFKAEYEKYKRGEQSDFNSPEFWDIIDIELLDLIRREFNKYDLVLTWNGKWFDEMFLNTRMLHVGLPGLSQGVKHMDVLQLARRVMKTRSKKLDAVKNFLKIDDEPDTHNWAEWRMAAAGIKEGFDFVAEHNIKDVEQLHRVAQKLKHHTRGFLY